MSLGPTPTKVQFDLSGGAVASYPFSFKFWVSSEVKAVLSTSSGDVDLVEGSDFSVSSPGAGGTLTRIGTWPTANRLTIYREMELSQGTDLIDGGIQAAEVYETMVDRSVALTQQIDEVVGRIVRFPVSDPSNSPDMPSAEDRASKYLAFGANGDPIAIAGSAGPYPVSPYMAAVLDDANAAEAQATLALQGAVAAHLAMKAFIESKGLTYDINDLPKLNWAANIADRHKLGELVPMIAESLPVDYAASSMSGDEYNPVIPLNIDQDISLAHYPLANPYLRGIKAKVLGVTDHAVTVSGSSVTFPNTPAANALLKAITEDAIVSNYLNTGEPANFANGTDFTTAATQRSLDIAGISYAITGINLVTRVATVSGSPATGAQTAIVYTHRIAGSTNARIWKSSGFVGVIAGDAGGEVIGGFRKMDRGQGHWHTLIRQGVTWNVETNNASSGSAVSAVSLGSANTNAGTIITDNQNGTPRTGKTTDPRTLGVHEYLWAVKYVA
ncbi:MAG: hypothetical protein KKB59_14105 [Spirochaetes bacterium]|nr:hypothetical protein [Spirochaetota bacterium]